MDDYEYVVERFGELWLLYWFGLVYIYYVLIWGLLMCEIVYVVIGKEICEILVIEIFDLLGFWWINFGVVECDVLLVVFSYVIGW